MEISHSKDFMEERLAMIVLVETKGLRTKSDFRLTSLVNATSPREARLQSSGVDIDKISARRFRALDDSILSEFMAKGLAICDSGNCPHGVEGPHLYKYKK